MTQDKINLASSFESDGYDSYAVLQNVDPIADLDVGTAVELISIASEAALSGEPVVVAGGHCYERKGYLTQDPLGGHRNTSYGRPNDDVILQITVRVPFSAVKASVEKIQGTRLQAEIEATEAQIAATEATRAELDGKIAALRQKRSNLSAQS